MKFIRSLYLGNRFFLAAGAIVLGCLLGYIYPLVLAICKVLLPVLLTLVVVEILLLYRVRKGIFARRDLPDKLSNGDENHIGVGTKECAHGRGEGEIDLGNHLHLLQAWLGNLHRILSGPDLAFRFVDVTKHRVQCSGLT